MMRIAVAGLVALLAGEAAGKSPRALRIEKAGDGGMVGLADGTIVAWNTRAEIQLRSPAGVWGNVQHLPASFAVGAAGAGDLAYALTNVVTPSRAVVSHLFAVAPEGTVRDLPGLPGDVESVASAAGKTCFATPAGVFELRPDGVVGSRIGDAASMTVLVARSGSAPIVCAEADLSKATYHPPTCRSDAPRWSATGTWTLPPFACGDVLIEPGDRELVSRSMATGQTLAHASIPRAAAVACGDALVLVGSDHVAALDPHTLQPRWSAPPQPHPITAIHLDRNQLLTFTPAGPRSAPRPKAAP